MLKYVKYASLQRITFYNHNTVLDWFQILHCTYTHFGHKTTAGKYNKEITRYTHWTLPLPVHTDTNGTMHVQVKCYNVTTGWGRNEIKMLTAISN